MTPAVVLSKPPRRERLGGEGREGKGRLGGWPAPRSSAAAMRIESRVAREGYERRGEDKRERAINAKIN
jgi:hypothetical protein